jgi:hypothetical protein
MSTAEYEKPSERFISAGIGLATLAMLVLVVAVSRLPSIAAWLIETPVFIGGVAGMTLYKRNRWGWAWTGITTVVCIVNLVAFIGTSFAPAGISPGTSPVTWGVAVLILIGWISVLSMERNRKPAPVPAPAPQLVIHQHDHVFHGIPQVPAAVAVASETVSVVPGTVERNSLARRARAALGPAAERRLTPDSKRSAAVSSAPRRT